MSDAENRAPGTGYRIGAVSRWSGISPETLRVWERRYAVVTPARSNGGDRLYSAEDLARLTLIKQLVDNGDSIGNLAHLERGQLEARLRTSDPVHALSEAGPVSTVVVGEQVGALLSDAATQLANVQLQQVFPRWDDFQRQQAQLQFDVLILEIPTLHEDTVRKISEAVHHSPARHTLLIYRYASRYALARLPLSNISTMRGPVDINDLKRRFHEILRHAAQPATPEPAEADTPGAAPHPLFEPAQLAALMQRTAAISCECPRHLAELVSSLGAFEHYSLECENRNAEDAALHNYLHQTSARARYLIERALQRVVEAENIDV